MTIFLDSHTEKETEQPLYCLTTQGMGIKVTWNEVFYYLQDGWITVRWMGGKVHPGQGIDSTGIK